MKALVKSLLKTAGVDPTALYQSVSAKSIEAAVRSQGLGVFFDRCREIVPDLSAHYTHGFDEAEYARYWEIKMRGLHAFQVSVALQAMTHLSGDGLVLADIGDSSGNHGTYLKAMAPERVGRVISVNLDPVAVDKVMAKGGDALLCRAEELDLEGVRPDLFMSFETVEHLTDPVRFLHALASKGSAEYLLMTVPYRRDSQFGGWHLRQPLDVMPERMTAEDVHVFEFSPDDWQLLARFAGFATVFRRIYFQYPEFGPWRATAPLWRKLDYEGFIAFLFKRDLRVAERYADW